MTKQKLISLIDLTSLNDNDTPDVIQTLCQRAQTPHGNVAAVCVYPQFVTLAKSLLQNTGISVATVCNFPKGKLLIDDTVSDIHQALMDGADEVDVVMPYRTFLNDQIDDVVEFLEETREASASSILKVIIESGAYTDYDSIYEAANVVLQAGVHFVKTSTGKIAQGATLTAAEAILTAIDDYDALDHTGIKLSGGIRSYEQAIEYTNLITRKMGENWITPQHVRFGASQLLSDLL